MGIRNVNAADHPHHEMEPARRPESGGKRQRRAGRLRRGPITRSREIWRYRSTLWLLVKRDLKVRYADSLLGYFWSVLDPLVMSLIYWFVFTQIFQRPGQAPYIIFLLLALLPWLWFTAGITEGAKALKSQARLIRSTAVPREIWVLRSVVAKGIEFTFAIPVLVIFMMFYLDELSVNSNIWLFAVAIIMQFVLLVGLGLLLAPLMILLKDIEPLIRLATRFLFYASPVIYGLLDVFGGDEGRQLLPDAVQGVYLLNPMSGILSAYRSGFFPPEHSWVAIGTSATICLVTFVVGWYVFARFEKTVLKEM